MLSGRTEKSLLKWPALITAVKADSIVPSNTTDRLALTYWTRSAAQDNVDALVKMGDYYLKGVGLPSGKPQPHKAAACYQTAAGTHTSAMAMFNLGWMHETGLGVMQVRSRTRQPLFDTLIKSSLFRTFIWRSVTMTWRTKQTLKLTCLSSCL